MKKIILSIVLCVPFASAFSQQGGFDYLQVYRRFKLSNYLVTGISNDTTMSHTSPDSLVTQYALKNYLLNHQSTPGSSGTVTSVATNNGTGITGGTITSIGTLAIDTATISTKANITKVRDSLQSQITGNTTNISSLQTSQASDLTGVVLNNSGLIHTSPATVTISNHVATITQTLATQNPNTVLAGPTSGTGTPTFRGLIAGDIPTLAEGQITNLTTDLAAKQNAISLTTTGTSGAATFSGSTLNIPNYASGITGGTITGPGLLYTTPTTGVVTGSSINFTPALINQSPYTVLGNNTSASATPTFSQVHVRAINATGSTYDGTKYLSDDGTWKAIVAGGSGGSGWGLTGNSGLSYLTNFLGTTDTASLRFRINNNEVLTLDTAGILNFKNNVFLNPATINKNIVIGRVGSNPSSVYLGQNNVLVGNSGQSPSSYNSSVNIGFSNTISGSSAIAIGSSNSGIIGISIGSGNTSTISTSIAIGNTVTSSGNNSVAIGAQSTASGNASGSFGSSSSTTGSFGFSLGRSISNAGSNALAFGTGTVIPSSISNAFVAGTMGNNNFPISNVYFGSGAQRDYSSAGVGAPYTINGSGSYGADFAGGDITIAGGQGTGTGLGGAIIFQTAGTSTTGATQNTLVERARFTPTGAVRYSTTTTPATPPAGTMVEWFDGTNKRWMGSDGVIHTYTYSTP